MASDPNKLTQFWQELKRRKVTRVITVYAAAAFVILELTDIVAPSLGLPDWTLNFIIILLCVGFIIAVIISWIYDVHPEGGIVKTEPAHKIEPGNNQVSSNSWKIATYVSGIIIIGLLAFNIFGNREKVQIDESLAKSIAVLPFQNFSEDPDQEFMCLGLTDEIINHLFQIESFEKVASLTSVLTYKESVLNSTEIAEELNVNYILEGTYKKIGDQLKVSAQLIDPKNDKHIWQNNYDRPYKEIISIQSDIALQIANQINVFITNPEQQSIKEVPTTNHEAYEYIQQAKYLQYQNINFADRDQMASLAHKAIELDPEYADAYAMLGFATLSDGIYYGDSEMESVAGDALQFYEMALDLDSKNVAALNGMGLINQWLEWDYIKAEEYYLNTIDNPSVRWSFTDAYPYFLIQMNRPADAREMISNRKQLLGSSWNKYIIIQSHILSGDIEEVRTLFREFLSTFGESEYTSCGDICLWLGEYDSAKSYLESAMQSENAQMSIPRWQSALASTYYYTGDHKQAESIISMLIQKSDTTSVGSPAFFIGWYYSGIGEVDSAFYWLEKAFNNRSIEMPWLKVNPAFDSLKDDERYWDLYERTGHKAYDDYIASNEPK